MAQLGRFGAWLHPKYDDAARTEFIVEAEELGYGTAWLGLGQASVADLEFAEKALDATSTITVATAIVNMWTNDASTIAESYRRIADKHQERLVLGVGPGHPESVENYKRPYEKIVEYLDDLDAGGVPQNQRILAALGDRTLALSAERSLGSHPYLVVPEHTRRARKILGPTATLAPEHKVVLSSDADHARALGREFAREPYLRLRNYVNNLIRLGYSEEEIADGGSDRLIDDLVLHGSAEEIMTGLQRHFQLGADHVAIQVITEPGETPMAGLRGFAPLLDHAATS